MSHNFYTVCKNCCRFPVHNAHARKQNDSNFGGTSFEASTEHHHKLLIAFGTQLTNIAQTGPMDVASHTYAVQTITIATIIEVLSSIG